MGLPAERRPRVLYLHGFASSPRGRKVEALEKRFAPERVEIAAPDLNAPDFARLDYVLASESLAGRARTSSVLADVGTSDHAPVVAVFD